MKSTILIVSGVAGALVSTLIGEWSPLLTTLGILMALDFVSGLAVAWIFKRSPKTKNGGIDSRVGAKGIIRKCMMIGIIVAAHQLDIALGVDWIQGGTAFMFVANETNSLLENAALMGVPLPRAILSALEVVNGKAGEESDKK